MSSVLQPREKLMSFPKPNPTVVSFATAGLGGCMGWTVVHPFNTVSIRMNLSSSGSTANSSMISHLTTIVRERGVMSLYTGLNAGLLRQVVYTTARLGLFEVFRDELAKYTGKSPDFLSRMTTSMVAGGIAAFISCPVEVTLVRISNDSSLPLDKRRNYRGISNAFGRILKEEGVKAFFSGSVPLVQRAAVVGAVQVGTYDQFRETFKSWGVTDQFTNVFYASMASGLLFAGCTMPLETIKNKMAFQKADPLTGILPYRSTAQAMVSIVKESGIRGGLYAGFMPYYIRCGGMTLLMFMSVEWLRKTAKPYM